MIINKNNYYFANYEFKLGSKINYGDDVLDFHTLNTLKTTYLDTVDNVYKVSTYLGDYYVDKKSRLFLNDILSFPMIPRHSFHTSSNFSLRPYLLKNLDVLSIDDFIKTELNVPKKFLKDALTVGVPDKIKLQKTLDTYLDLKFNGDIESLYKKLLDNLTVRHSVNLRITEDFIYLTNVFLECRCTIEDNYVTLYLKDDLDLLVKSLDHLNIRYEINSNSIRCNSRMLSLMFKDSFDSFKFLYTLSDKHMKYFIDLFVGSSFYVSDILSVKLIQWVLFRYGVVTHISEYNKEGLYLLNFIPEYKYSNINGKYYLPIINIEEVEDFSQLLEII